MKTTNASNARQTFARLLESVIKDDQPIVIVRYREPLAAIVPISRLLPAESAAQGQATEVTAAPGRAIRLSRPHARA